MPSDRKQFNVRMPPEWDDDRIERIRRLAAEQLGIDVSRTDLVFMGLRELETRMSPIEAHQAEQQPERPKKPSRKKNGG